MNFYQLYHGVKQQQSDSIGTLINTDTRCVRVPSPWSAIVPVLLAEVIFSPS